MGKVFISYSRKDSSFVRRLYDALSERGRKVWVDWEGIPPTDKWLVKIHSAIDEADAMLFVISPDSVASKVCEIELDHAIKQHKRLVPVLYREVEMSSVRSELSEINYIFARDSDSFDIFCDNLITALDADLLWIQSHTRLLVRAAEWEREGREASYTLRGHDLNGFEKWLAKSPEKEPKPTTLQLNYLLTSRQTVTRRQRIVGGAIAIALSLAVGLGTIAYFQNKESVRQETIAGARQLINKSEALRDDAVSEGSKGASIRAAIKSLAILHGLGIQSLDADRAVRKSMVLPKWINFELKPESIDASAFAATNAYLVLFSGRKHLRVWDTVLRRESGSCTMPLTAAESMSAVATTADGTLAATAVYRATKEDDATEVTVWSMLDCSRHLQVRIPGRLQAISRNRIALNGDGENLFVRSGSKLRSWDVASRSELSLDFSNNVKAFAPSPDGLWLATLERKGGERKRWVRIRKLAGNRMVREWEHPEHGLWMQWGADGLVVGNQKTATIYNPNSGDLLYRDMIRDNGKFAHSPDGRLVALPIENYSIQIRDVVNNTEVMRNSHDNEVANLAFGLDSRSLTTVDELKRQIRVWPFESSGAFAELQEDSPIQRIRFSRDGAHLYTKTDRNVSAWQLPSRGELSAPQRQENLNSTTEVFGQYRVESSGTAGSGGATTTIKVRAADTSLESHTILLDTHALAASVSQDGDWLAVIVALGTTRGGVERRLELWNVATERMILTRSLAPVLDADMAAYLNFAGGDRYLVVGMRDGIEILDTKHFSPVAKVYHWGVTLTAVQGDGTLAATTGRNGVVRIWDMSSRNEIVQIEQGNVLRSIALSSDSRWLATLDDTGSVRLWVLGPDDLIEQACKGMAETCP